MSDNGWLADAPCTKEEFLIATMAGLFGTGRFMIAGVNSPIPAAAGLLRERQVTDFQVSVHGDPSRTPFVDGGVEAFDMAAQGRLDVFVFGGVQVDGGASINLVGIGGYPKPKKRFPGTFGSASLYYLIPNIVLFFPSHTRRSLVETVDFKSASPMAPAGAYRTGFPKWLLTDRCLFRFDLDKNCFSLVSIHPGQALQDIVDNTGFEFEGVEKAIQTQMPDAAALAVIRNQVRDDLAIAYPDFVRLKLQNGWVS
jgi:glutaconate CoA-transferase subunit B